MAACTHAVLSGNAVEKVNNSVLEELIVTNTIPLEQQKRRMQKADCFEHSVSYRRGYQKDS